MQGFVWNVPSFDQWGVELGKVLAGRVRTALSSSRKGGLAIGDATAGFNPSTAAMLKRYLAHIDPRY